jgi:hypothetical protein
MYTEEQLVNVNLYLRRRGLTCRECDTNHWLLRMVSPAPDIDPFDSEPTAIRIAVECGYCGTERTTIVPLSVCYPQYNL